MAKANPPFNVERHHLLLIAGLLLKASPIRRIHHIHGILESQLTGKTNFSIVGNYLPGGRQPPKTLLFGVSAP